jgi:hypothetical protein
MSGERVHGAAGKRAQVYGPFSAISPHHDAVQNVVGYRILVAIPYFPDFDEEIFTKSYDVLRDYGITRLLFVSVRRTRIIIRLYNTF